MKKLHNIYCILLLSFLLGVHKGYLALWESGKSEPSRIYPVRADSLPEADQAALKAKIPVRDNAALTQMLEDFLS